jgi:general secretion pathway protein D
MRKLAGLLAGTGLFVLAATASSEAAPIVAFDPSVSIVSAGQSFQVDVGITDAVDLYAFQFDLAFDASFVRVDGILEGSFLTGAGATFWDPGAIDNAGGVVTLIFDTLLGPGGATGSGVLATIQFTALAPGSATLGLVNTTFLDSGLMDVSAAIQEGEVNVQASVATVPEPASGLLLFGGLAALAARRRTRSQERMRQARGRPER